ncbi:MAG: helix-hairpin-helix domain-containing protein [Candidatus Heimdallarchaeaceae archaeon]
MFGIYLDNLRQAEDLLEKGKHNEAILELNLLEKGVELSEIEKLAAMLLNCKIMIKIGDYEKSFLLAKTAFRKSVELSHPLLVVDSTIVFLEATNGLGLLYDSSKKEQTEFTKMITRSEDILKSVKDLKKKDRDLRTNNLGNFRGIMEHSQLKTVPASDKAIKTKISNIPIEKVKGVGQKATALKEAGYSTAVDLSIASVDDLVKLKGIGAASAPKLIQAAKDLIESS